MFNYYSFSLLNLLKFKDYLIQIFHCFLRFKQSVFYNAKVNILIHNLGFFYKNKVNNMNNLIITHNYLFNRVNWVYSKISYIATVALKEK